MSLAGHWILSVSVDLAKKILKGTENGKVVYAHSVYTGLIQHECPFIGGAPKLSSANFLKKSSDTTADVTSLEFFHVRNAVNHLDLNQVFFTAMIFSILCMAKC